MAINNNFDIYKNKKKYQIMFSKKEEEHTGQV